MGEERETLRRGGEGESSDQIKAILRGKRGRIQPYVSGRRRGKNGNCSNKRAVF